MSMATQLSERNRHEHEHRDWNHHRQHAQVGISHITDFENRTVFKPGAHQEKAVNAMLDDLIPWTQALQSLRAPRS